MTAYTAYYVSWSPKTGEATYTRFFLSEAERAEYIRRVYAASVHTWESAYTVQA